VRRSQERSRTRSERCADAVTRFAGSVWSVFFHALFFAGWILWNSGALGLEPFDRPPFVMLAMLATLEELKRDVQPARVLEEIERARVRLSAELLRA
jgi:uncharacterized membrane protein